MVSNSIRFGLGLMGGLLLVSAATTQAWAGGDYSFRTGVQSNIEACPSGHEVELFHEYANVWSWDEDLAIACLTGKDRASWVLASATLCDDEDSASGERYCSGKEAAAARVPALMRDQKFWDLKGKSPPYTIYYQLLRWGLGHDCTIEHQAFDYGIAPDDKDTFHFWHCADLTFGDTFTGNDPGGPLTFHPHQIWTKSVQPLKTDYDSDPTAQVPLDFAFGAEVLYTYRFR